MSTSEDADVTLTLPHDAALVLLELLAPVEALGPLQIVERSDLAALWALEAELERRLTATFDSEYVTRLYKARARLSERLGDMDVGRAAGDGG